VVVVEYGRPVGIITERDVVRLYASDPEQTKIPVRKVMSSPVLTVTTDNSINEAAERMLNARVRHLVVLNHVGLLAGVIGEHDLTQSMIANLIDTKFLSESIFLNTLVNTLPDLVWLKDVNGIYLACNPRFESFFGEKKQDIVGKTDYDFVDKDLADFFRKHDRLAMDKDGPSVNEEWVTFADDGHRELLETIKTPMRDAQGQLVGVLGVARNITEHKRIENALLESEEKLRGLYELSPLGIALTDMNGRYIEFNEAFRNICGYTIDELSVLDYWELTPKKYEVDEVRQLESLAKTGRYGPYEKEYIRKDGSFIPLRLNGVLMPRSDGQKYIWSIVEDISEHKRAEAEVQIAATAFESQEGVIVTDDKCNILKVNRAFTDITGYIPNEVIGKNPSLLSAGRHDRAFYAEMWETINTSGSWKGEIWNRRKDGEVYPEHITITAVKDKEDRLTNYVGTLTDITQSKAAAERIERLAFYDSLTQLPNRRLLVDRLKQALASSTRSGRQGAILFLDLDHFKTLNDSLGHEMGDRLLQQVSQRLVSSVRDDDTVARLGGDEFVVMLEDLNELSMESASQAEAVAEKILANLNQPYDLNNHTYRSTSSIGITLFNNHDADTEEILKQADIAMYQAKRSGRNSLRFFDPKMQELINRRVAIESELHEAIEKQQFQLYYQIQIQSSGHVIGAEALLRWMHPVRGMVSPAEFIPIAEETGLILPIGKWVLETACAQLESWQENPLTRDLSLSVNVSAKEIHQADFMAQVEDAIRRYRFNPCQLKLELTESMLLENVDYIIDSLNRLRQTGIQFSLDDFGTGYSSLQYLRKLPIDQLKIDQSFVHDITFDEQDRSIVRTIIAMAHSMDMEVIAEGVETEEQKQRLLHKGCNQFQG
jgi:diguanylate cyclase (GGDEF)-like protein/PAS domain S-box-containing protein